MQELTSSHQPRDLHFKGLFAGQVIYQQEHAAHGRVTTSDSHCESQCTSHHILYTVCTCAWCLESVLCVLSFWPGYHAMTQVVWESVGTDCSILFSMRYFWNTPTQPMNSYIQVPHRSPALYAGRLLICPGEFDRYMVRMTMVDLLASGVCKQGNKECAFGIMYAPT